MEEHERISSIGPAGVVARACRHRAPGATREATAEIAVGINRQLARARSGRMGGGEARSTFAEIFAAFALRKQLFTKR
jgi:hypothetical protein